MHRGQITHPWLNTFRHLEFCHLPRLRIPCWDHNLQDLSSLGVWRKHCFKTSCSCYPLGGLRPAETHTSGPSCAHAKHMLFVVHARVGSNASPCTTRTSQRYSHGQVQNRLRGTAMLAVCALTPGVKADGLGIRYPERATELASPAEILTFGWADVHAKSQCAGALHFRRAGQEGRVSAGKNFASSPFATVRPVHAQISRGVGRLASESWVCRARARASG